MPGPLTGTVPFAIPEGAAPNLHGSASTTTGIGVNADILYFYIGGLSKGSLDAGGGWYFAVQINAASGLILGIPGVSGFAPAVGGVIFNYYTDGANTHTDGTEDTLYTDTLAAGALNTNGAKLSGYYQIAITGHAVSTDRIRLYFAGTAIYDSGALNAASSGSMRLDFEIIRVSATVVRCSVLVNTGITLFALGPVYTEITGLTLSNTQILKLTDISTGTNSAAGDVTAKMGKVLWQP